MCIRDRGETEETMEPPVLPAQQENIEREAVDMLEGITALMTGYNEVHDIIPVSYTHLDVYKRQPLKNMDTLIERKKRFTPRRIYGGAGVLFLSLIHI